MAGPETAEETVEEDALPEDMHIRKESVPGGWIYITFVRRKKSGKEYTSQVSTVYVPGRR